MRNAIVGTLVVLGVGLLIGLFVILPLGKKLSSNEVELHSRGLYRHVCPKLYVDVDLSLPVSISVQASNALEEVIRETGFYSTQKVGTRVWLTAAADSAYQPGNLCRPITADLSVGGMAETSIMFRPGPVPLGLPDATKLVAHPRRPIDHIRIRLCLRKMVEICTPQLRQRSKQINDICKYGWESIILTELTRPITGETYLRYNAGVSSANPVSRNITQPVKTIVKKVEEQCQRLR